MNLRQPYVAAIGAGGTIFVVLLAVLMAAHDPKTAVVIGIGIGTAMLTKSATSFGQGAPNTAVALFCCFAAAVLGVLSIVGIAPALTAMTENGLAMALSGIVGLFAALLGSAQDRPR